jgi:hypothetical protein
MRAPNASESGKESVASSHTSPFYESSDSIIGYLKHYPEGKIDISRNK